jgi:GMP synthase (glutamine-hydrolysing)
MADQEWPESRASAEVLVLRHVPWEGLGAFAPLLAARRCTWRYVDLFAGAAVPDLRAARAVFVMGGPMGVYEAERYPFLRAELAALRQALDAGVPLLGVCLGSQLLAAALGARVYPNPRGKELGWGPVYRTPAGASDPILGAFRAEETVLHWHGDVFELPAGAVALATSAQSPYQAFRWGRAWGLLFHVEADEALVRAWLQEPAMWAEAAAVDPALPARIAAEAPRHQARLAPLRAAVVAALLGPAERGG